LRVGALTRRVWRRRTETIGALALVTTGLLCALEFRQVWRRGSARATAQSGQYLKAGRAATRETVAVVRAGYQAAPSRENALFNMLAAFATTFGAARAVTHMIRAEFGPFGNLVVGRTRIHHFVPGIVVAFVAGGASIGLRREQLDRWFAIPFGGGVALVLDEAALLLELEDVYWTRKGVLSVQITMATGALLASLGLVVRLVRRGHRDVLGAPDARS
jgi:hypothetical protein